jgi:hypothetical protein
MPEFTMDQIIDALDRGHQRATYSAVAALLDMPPRLLMQGRERDQRHSWVVSRRSGAPTGYTQDQTHPSLLEKPTVLDSREELVQWLEVQ